MNPALQWLALYVITFSFGFPLGALRVENFLPQQLFLCGLFAALLAATQKVTSGSSAAAAVAPASSAPQNVPGRRLVLPGKVTG